MTITKETVMAVNKYHEKYPSMTQAEIAALCKCSSSSVGNILNGMYKHLLEDTKKVEDKERTVKSDIPYETYKKLVTCELAVKELIEKAVKPHDSSVALFLSYKYVDSVLQRYFPDEYKARTNELYDDVDYEEDNTDDYKD